MSFTETGYSQVFDRIVRLVTEKGLSAKVARSYCDDIVKGVLAGVEEHEAAEIGLLPELAALITSSVNGVLTLENQQISQFAAAFAHLFGFEKRVSEWPELFSGEFDLAVTRMVDESTNTATAAGLEGSAGGLNAAFLQKTSNSPSTLLRVLSVPLIIINKIRGIELIKVPVMYVVGWVLGNSGPGPAIKAEAIRIGVQIALKIKLFLAWKNFTLWLIPALIAAQIVYKTTRVYDGLEANGFGGTKPARVIEVDFFGWFEIRTALPVSFTRTVEFAIKATYLFFVHLVLHKTLLFVLALIGAFRGGVRVI